MPGRVLRTVYRFAASWANFVAPIAVRVARRLPRGRDHKLVRALDARRGLVQRIRAQARAVRDPARPLAWFHAPSVGEGLQAQPVIVVLRAARPDVQVAYTFFSPSAESFASRVGADIVDYLPFDTASNADAMLDALTPTVLVFAKLDVWPTLVERAHARGVPVLLVSGTVAPHSARLDALPRALTHEAFASLAAVGAIDQANAERLARLGVPPDRITVTGDTRFDQVAARAASVDRAGPLLAPLASDRFTLVAGSTWPADEQVLLPAWAAFAADGGADAPDGRDARGGHEGLRARPRLVIAPHEPTAAHLEPIEAWAASAGLRHARLDAAGRDTDVIVVDRVGVLGQLYALAQVAFVGGGFHRAGLHSVIEPAAFGAPVLFGPRHDMSREAGLLLAAQAARVVTDAASMQQNLTELGGNVALRRNAGDAARHLVERETGAVGASLSLVQRFL